MTQGIYVRPDRKSSLRRPKSKKEIKELCKQDPSLVELESTCAEMFKANEPQGPLNEIPDGFYTFVGPDPFRDRRFYGNVVKHDGKVSIK